jgi:hypothetical protein
VLPETAAQITHEPAHRTRTTPWAVCTADDSRRGDTCGAQRHPGRVTGRTDVPLIEQTIGAFFDAMAARQPQRDALVSVHQSRPEPGRGGHARRGRRPEGTDPEGDARRWPGRPRQEFLEEFSR